jgi:hypothetical protein
MGENFVQSLCVRNITRIHEHVLDIKGDTFFLQVIIIIVVHWPLKIELKVCYKSW